MSTIYKNNGAHLLRRRRQRAPLRGEDLADDRVEAVAVLHGGEDGRPGAAHLERVAAHHVQVRADGRREVDFVDDEGSLFAASAGPSGLPPFLRRGRLAFAFCAIVSLLNARLASALPPWPAARGRAWRRPR